MRARLERWLTGLWYEGRRTGWMPVLIGLSRLYGWGLGWRCRTSAFALPVPVLVVGNLTAGGTGKTPLTLALAQALRARGWHPGILSRGYGGRHSTPMEVTSVSSPEEVGDEPVLMAGRLLAPVWVGRARVAAGQALLRTHPDVDVLLCDDGLQHRALMRSVEVVVVDGGRGWGNGRLLPAGPLREMGHPFAQGGNGNFPPDDDEGQHRGRALQIHQNDQGGHDHQFIYHGVEKSPKSSGLVQATRQVTIEGIGQGSKHEKGRCSQSGIRNSQPMIRKIGHAHKQWDQEQAKQREQIGNGHQHDVLILPIPVRYAM